MNERESLKNVCRLVLCLDLEGQTERELKARIAALKMLCKHDLNWLSEIEKQEIIDAQRAALQGRTREAQSDAGNGHYQAVRADFYAGRNRRCEAGKRNEMALGEDSNTDGICKN